jgi:hypothetical protein
VQVSRTGPLTLKTQTSDFPVSAGMAVMQINQLLKFWRVDIRDWIWFVFVLRGDEFSEKLSIGRYAFCPQLGGIDGLARDRNRAHKIDNALRA